MNNVVPFPTLKSQEEIDDERPHNRAGIGLLAVLTVFTALMGWWLVAAWFAMCVIVETRKAL